MSDKNNLKLNDELANKIESMSENSIRNEKGNKKNYLWIVLVIVGVIIAGLLVFYIIKAQKYKEVYFPKTYINGIDASAKTPDEIREEIKNQCSDFTVRIYSKGREPQEIHASDIGLHYVAGTELDDLLNNQNIWLWPIESAKDKHNDISTITKLDDSLLEKECSKLAAFDDSSAVSPVDAYLGEYDESSNEYQIVKENDGNIVVNKPYAVSAIKEAILTLKPDIDLEKSPADIYSKANIRSDNKELAEEKKKYDSFVRAKVIYPDYDIVLDGNTLQNWLVPDNNGSFKYDENKIKNFVTMVAASYDTLGLDRRLVTQYGNSTTVSGGDFGWKVDQEAETAEIKRLLKEGKETTREPVFSSRGITHGENDWGDTYVEINLAKQHLFFVKDGNLIVSSDLVSGGLQRKAPTPTGVYDINYKGRNAVLRGPRRADGSYSYESPVSYWMPFNKGIGLHDAKWRSRFGGTIYKYDGSHGCINLPLSKAKTIYENISTGVPVIVYSDDFEIMNMPEDPEEIAKRLEKEKKEEQAKIEAEAKKAIKVPEKAKETKAPVKDKPKAQPASRPAEPETVPQETQAETMPQETAPIEWGPAFDRSESVQETQAETIPVTEDYGEPEVYIDAENVPGE